MQIRKIASMIIIVAAVSVLTACGFINEGTITDKVFEPAHTASERRCHFIGKIYVCSNRDVDYDDQWHFIIEGDYVTGVEIDVTEEEYNSYEIGDYYPGPTTS